MFKSVYMKAYDNVINSIKDRFNQSNLLVYKNTQDVFLNVTGKSFDTELASVFGKKKIETLKDDLNKYNLNLFENMINENQRDDFNIHKLVGVGQTAYICVPFYLLFATL